MAFPLSLSTGEFALFVGCALALIFLAAFLALLLSAIIGLSISRLLYLCVDWCVRKIRDSYLPGATSSQVQATLREFPAEAQKTHRHAA